MIYNVNELRKDTVALIKSIEMQIAEVEKKAKEMGIDVHVLQYSDGTWPLIPLLSAKATAYNTLVMLQEPRPSTGRSAPRR